MAIVIKVKGADWSGKGLQNINPFVASDALTYGFDFKERSGKFEDITGNHSVTPYSNDGAGGVFEPNYSVAQTTSDQLGINVNGGVLVSTVDNPVISSNSNPFTVMVVGADSGVNSVNTGAILFGLGYGVSSNGIGIIRLANNISVNVENSTGNLSPVPGTIVKTKPSVLFLTYDGSNNWSCVDMTTGGTNTGTNASLSVNDPMTVFDSIGLGKITLGGNTRNDTPLYGNNVSIYQQAMWNKVLTMQEIQEQYERCKASRPSLSL